MARKLDFMDIKQILTLKVNGFSNRKVSQTLSVNRNTVNYYAGLFKANGQSYRKLLQLDEGSLQELFPDSSSIDKKRYDELSLYFEDIRKQRYRTGFTFQHHWREYKQQHPQGYGYTQYMEHYHRWEQHLEGSLKLDHKAAEKLFVDFAGKKLQVVDKQTGQVIQVEVFVAVLPASQYGYVEAVATQQRDDFIGCMNNCLWYIGGVPRAIVSDNLKTAVTKASKYEPVINKTLKSFALHYSTVIDPTRPYSPQDKALVEAAVKLVYQRIFYPMRDMTFFSIKELNVHIAQLLESYNNYCFQRMNCSRKELFLSVERPKLSPLPDEPYALRYFKRAKVQKIGHIYFSEDKHYYSVPYQYIGRQVEVQYSSDIVEIFYNHKRIAMHKRNRQPGAYTTNKQHLSSTHQAYSQWSPEFFKNKASAIGERVGQFVFRLINTYAYPEQGYKQAMGIIQLKRQYGAERLINACKRAATLDQYRYHYVKNILEKGLDAQELNMDLFNSKQSHIPDHENIRGPQSYQ